MDEHTANINFLSLRDKKFITRISLAFAAILSLILILQLASFFILRKQIGKEFDSATLVSAAGNQQMRSQRITLLAMALLNVQSQEVRTKTRQALQQEIQEMETTHQALIAGNPVLGVSSEKSKEVRDLFFGQPQLDSRLRNFLSIAREFSLVDNSQLVPTNPLIIRLTDLSRELLLLFEKLTVQYKDEGNTGIKILELSAERILVVIICASLGIGLFIFIPMAKRLRSEFAERSKIRLELIEQNRELEQFATIVAHDLKAPLNNIGGFSQYLRSRLNEAADREALSLLTHIELGVQRMGKMINELLQYARITRKEKRKDKIALTALMHKIINDFQVEIEKASATIEIKPLPAITGDAVQIEHLFHNLLSNAIKYRDPERNLRISIYPNESDQGKEDSSMTVIIVEDNGKGFPAGMENQMFEPFKRLNPEESEDGIGFGLALCKKITKRHGGSIWAEQSTTNGAKFYVSLPRS